MKTESVDTWFLSTQFRSMWRTLWWAFRDCLAEWISGSWTFNQKPCSCRCNGDYPLIPSMDPETRHALPSWGRRRQWWSAGGRRVWHPGATSGTSLPRAWTAQLKRDVGLRKISSTPKTGFLVKDPSHQPSHPEAMLPSNPVQGSLWPLLVPLWVGAMTQTLKDICSQVFIIISRNIMS